VGEKVMAEWKKITKETNIKTYIKRDSRKGQNVKDQKMTSRKKRHFIRPSPPPFSHPTIYFISLLEIRLQREK